MRANIDNPCHRLRDAVAAPLSMRGRHVGHGAVCEFSGDLVHSLEGEFSRDPRFVPKLLFSISGLKITFTLSAILVHLTPLSKEKIGRLQRDTPIFSSNPYTDKERLASRRPILTPKLGSKSSQTSTCPDFGGFNP